MYFFIRVSFVSMIKKKKKKKIVAHSFRFFFLNNKNVNFCKFEILVFRFVLLETCELIFNYSFADPPVIK